MNTSTGEDAVPAIPFIPAGAKATSLTIVDGVLYTTTTSACGGASAGVWAIDLNGAEHRVSSFKLAGSDIVGLGGAAFGTDGTVYIQTSDGPMDTASNKWGNTLLALSAKDLEPQGYCTSPRAAGLGGASPVVIEHQGRDFIVSAGPDGRLSLLDSQSPGGDDHKTAISQTPPLTTANSGTWGGLSSWQDADDTRWILASVWGPLNPDLKVPVTNGATPNGSIVAFKLEERNGKPVLTPGWVSRDMKSPLPPVITSGMIFALAAGDYSRQGQSTGSTHATLYALDGATGKEMYSTGNQVAAPGNLTGVTIANGRVYFTTNDGTLYAFGIYLER